jgi:hypothetical protein
MKNVPEKGLRLTLKTAPNRYDFLYYKELHNELILDRIKRDKEAQSHPEAYRHIVSLSLDRK